MRRSLALALAMVTVGTVGTVAVAIGRADAPTEIRIYHSRFLPASVTVPAGRPVTFVLVNDDPIDHEWIAGDEGVHERHRSGTEPVHAVRPTEVTVPAGEVRRTTVVFAEAGSYRFVCHLPGHEAYGMVGTVVVRP